jgi:hypothetical protein
VRVKSTGLLTPLYAAVTMIQPLAVGSVVTLNAAATEPCGTVTEAGTKSAGLLLERSTLTFPAGLDMVAVQVVPPPPVTLVVAQESEDKAGVDHRVKLADWEEAPIVAVTEPAASAAMLPIVALKVAEVVPGCTGMLAGTVINGEVDVSARVVPFGAGCDTVAVQELIAPDIAPLGLQARDVTKTGALRGITTDCEELL